MCRSFQKQNLNEIRKENDKERPSELLQKQEKQETRESEPYRDFTLCINERKT